MQTWLCALSSNHIWNCLKKWKSIVIWSYMNDDLLIYILYYVRKGKGIYRRRLLHQKTSQCQQTHYYIATLFLKAIHWFQIYLSCTSTPVEQDKICWVFSFGKFIFFFWYLLILMMQRALKLASNYQTLGQVRNGWDILDT